MESRTLLAIVSTVLPFLAFLGIVAWAWSRRRRGAFRDAANAPFALPDDDAAATPAPERTESQR